MGHPALRHPKANNDNEKKWRTGVRHELLRVVEPGCYWFVK
jgi:hypothetical protein